MENRPAQFLDDKESLEALNRQLPDREYSLYRSLGALSLESAFQGRKFVVFTLAEGRPLDPYQLTFGTFRVDPYKGAFAEVDGLSVPEIGHLPQQVLDLPLFLQIPQNFIYKWKGKTTQKGVQFAPHYAVLIKSRSREHLAVDGHTYCVTLNKFRERFPDVPLRY